MKRSFLMSLSVCAIGCGISFAQPPGSGEGRPPRDGEPREAAPRDGGPPPHNPLMDALDPDHDHVISAEEIKSAIAALLKLDKNKDGQLTEDEFRPDFAGEGFGPPPRERDAGPGRPPRGEGDRPREGAVREGRDGPPGGFGPPGGRGPGGPGGPGAGGPPDPVRFIEHVMEFDANKDGLMSREELMKFAEQGMRRGPGGQEGGRGGRPEGEQGRPARPGRPE